MKKLPGFLLVLLLAFCGSAHAAIITVDFAFDDLAEGDFSFDDSLNGNVLGWGDLVSFNLTINPPGSSSYDLDFVLSPGGSVYDQFQFDSSMDAFLTRVVGGYPMILSHIKADASAGFFIRPGIYGVDQVISEFPYGVAWDMPWRDLTISRRASEPVPVPAPLLLLIAGLMALVVSKRKSAN
jgi:hypothetical protein